jgi:hypothetical protein
MYGKKFSVSGYLRKGKDSGRYILLMRKLTESYKRVCIADDIPQDERRGNIASLGEHFRSL